MTNWIISDLKSNKIRAVEATWNENENTAYLSLYVDGEIDEEDLEDISIACAEIIAHCSNGLLKENFIKFDSSTVLIEKILAYKREEK